MKIHYLGTCSGTEPFEGMHHCSLVFEIGDTYYWFDVGEGCAYTAHTNGIDVLRTKCIFVSHSHADHIGGFPHLLTIMCKLTHVRSEKMKHDNTLRVFFPTPGVFDSIKVASRGVPDPKFPYKIIEDSVSAGVVFEDEQIRVSAISNDHTGGQIPSYSYLVEAEGKRVVFSGDVKTPSELDSIADESCDLLIMETGHHAVKDVCDYAKSRGIKTLRFNHHGREIIYDRPRAEEYVADYSENNHMDIKLCYDTMIDEI